MPEGSPDQPAPMHGDRPSPEFLKQFEARAGDSGVLRFDEFVDLALYDSSCGYYRRNKRRVGYGPGTDFFTASTSGAVFGNLVAAACTKLVGESEAAKYTFIEIGAETDGGVLEGVSHPFANIRTLRIGDTLKLEGQCVVFSNELFDAQPFRRFRFGEGGWHEVGVSLDDNGRFHETQLVPSEPLPAELLRQPATDYTIDLPVAAARLASVIARQPWTGLFVAFDYGKSWRELIEACPAGTARGYYRHTQINDLLARPGDQDLTCHVCWDWLEEALRQSGFQQVSVATQESFFMRYGESYIAGAINADAARFTPRKQSLMQLLHGAHLGQKFQVLSGLRL